LPVVVVVAPATGTWNSFTVTPDVPPFTPVTVPVMVPVVVEITGFVVGAGESARASVPLTVNRDAHESPITRRFISRDITITPRNRKSWCECGSLRCCCHVSERSMIEFICADLKKY
jgi:hypothetical protein